MSVVKGEPSVHLSYSNITSYNSITHTAMYYPEDEESQYLEAIKEMAEAMCFEDMFKEVI